MSDQVVSIRDEASGTRAAIQVAMGFNCFEFQVPIDARTIDVLWSEPGFRDGNKRASGSGIPILAPFAGRVRGTRFSWQGRQYAELACPSHAGNAIHGFALDRPWRVIEKSASRVVGEFCLSAADPKLLEQWPADFRIRAEYEVAGRTLAASYRIENSDTKPLPLSFGVHPYFRVPLGGGSVADCRVSLPAERRWEQVEMLPTGRQLDLADAAAFRCGLPFEAMRFDDVFTGVRFDGDRSVSRIVDLGSGRSVTLSFDRAFRNIVVYNPPHREAVCIEPYTSVPNAAELQAAGINAGLMTLPPGGSFSAAVSISLG